MLDELRRSPILQDLTPIDRRVGRIAATVPLGAVAAILAATIGGALVLAAFSLGPEGKALAGRLMETVGQTQTPPGLTGTLFVVCLLAFANGGMALAFVGVAAVLHRRRLLSYFTAAPRFRWRLLLLGLALFAAVVGPLLILSAALDPKGIHPPLLSISDTLPGRALYVVAVVVLLLIAAAAEELLFRGWLIKVLGGFVRQPVALLLISGGLFSLVHLDPNLDAFLIRMVMGVGLGWMALRLGGTEFAIGAHAANNILILLFIQPMSLAAEPPHPFPAEILLIGPLMLAGYIGLAEVAARWTPLRRWAGVVDRKDPLAVFD